MKTPSLLTWLPRRLAYAWAILSALGSIAAEESSFNDPSDVTRMVTSLSPLLEYHRYENQDQPDDGMWEIKVEAQYSKGAVLFLADLGYGYRTGTEESGITDSRIRFFNVPYRNEDEDALISALGWSIDSNIPLGDADKGLGSGNWVFAPGVIWTHDFRWIELSPNLIYQFTWANQDLKEQIPNNEATDSRAVRLEANFSIVTPERIWLLITPAYIWDVDGTEDGGFIKAYGGYNLTPSIGLGLEGQYNFDVRNAQLQEVIRGEVWKLRLQMEFYF